MNNLQRILDDQINSINYYVNTQDNYSTNNINNVHSEHREKAESITE